MSHQDRGPRLCALGTIVNTHGIRGEVRMLPYNPDSETLRPGLSITLCWPDRSAPTITRTIDALRIHKRFRLLQLDGCVSVTAAEALVGADVCIEMDQLPRLGPNEVYHHQLIGLQVVTVDGQMLGTVERVLSTGEHGMSAGGLQRGSRPVSNDVCVVRSGEREHLIPLIADVVRQIDVPGGRLVIEPIPGLLEE